MLRCRLPRMPRGLVRIYGHSQLHFITFSCYHRLPLLGSADARDCLLKILSEVRDRYDFALVGYVVMPEHVHVLISEPPAATPSTVMQVLKQRSSRQIQVLCPMDAQDIPRFWERRFYDFNIRTWEKLNEKLRYMHMNPVQRKLVSEPQLWPWSSFQFQSKGVSGKIRLDIVPWARPQNSLEEVAD